MTTEEIERECDIERLRRKLDQAWDMAGLARQDGDKADENRRTQEALHIIQRLRQLSDT